ncbi:MAG: glycosyltransferase family 2 protein [Chloroflexi bacterium]|nr:glycosyltransferase family 2 protein [Chloroflexota bacterium]
MSIVIVSWNVREALLACLAALPDAVTPAYAYEVIVVDNASSDGSVAAVRKAFPSVHIIANSANRLYTAAANQGLTIAVGRHLLLINPDAIPQPHSLARLIAYADQHPRAGLLGPRIFRSDGRDDLRTGREYPTPWSETLDWFGFTRRFPHHPFWAANLRPDFPRDRTASVPLLSGACLLLSQRLPSSLRRLDEYFPMYGEDVDLCRRVQQAGYETVLVADAEVFHAGGQSSRQIGLRTALLAVEGVQRYFRRWRGSGAARRHRMGMALVAVVKWTAFTLLGLIGLESDPAYQRRFHRALLAWALGRGDIQRLMIEG